MKIPTLNEGWYLKIWKYNYFRVEPPTKERLVSTKIPKFGNFLLIEFLNGELNAATQGVFRWSTMGTHPLFTFVNFTTKWNFTRLKKPSCNVIFVCQYQPWGIPCHLLKYQNFSLISTTTANSLKYYIHLKILQLH